MSSTAIALAEEQPEAQAHALAGPEPWIVVVFDVDESLQGYSWERDRKPKALEDMDEVKLVGRVVKATNGQEAIQLLYAEKIAKIELARKEAGQRRRRGNKDDEVPEFTDADGHYFAAPLFRSETQQAVLQGEWKANMEMLA